MPSISLSKGTTEERLQLYCTKSVGGRSGNLTSMRHSVSQLQWGSSESRQRLGQALYHFTWQTKLLFSMQYLTSSSPSIYSNNKPHLRLSVIRIASYSLREELRTKKRTVNHWVFFKKCEDRCLLVTKYFEIFLYIGDEHDMRSTSKRNVIYEQMDALLLFIATL